MIIYHLCLISLIYFYCSNSSNNKSKFIYICFHHMFQYNSSQNAFYFLYTKIKKKILRGHTHLHPILITSQQWICSLISLSLLLLLLCYRRIVNLIGNVTRRAPIVIVVTVRIARHLLLTQIHIHVGHFVRLRVLDTADRYHLAMWYAAEYGQRCR